MARNASPPSESIERAAGHEELEVHAKWITAQLPRARRRLTSSAMCLVLLLVLATVSGCATRDAGYDSKGYGTIIGSVEVILARPARSILDGFLEENLSVLPMTYAFQFGHAARSWTDAPREVGTAGKPRAFSLSLKPGRNVVENLELQLHSGPSGTFLAMISPTHGREFKLNLEFPVERGRITYIGRIRVKLPTQLKFYQTKYKLTVEDKAAEDYAAMAELLENSPLPVHKALATRIP